MRRPDRSWHSLCLVLAILVSLATVPGTLAQDSSTPVAPCGDDIGPADPPMPAGLVREMRFATPIPDAPEVTEAVTTLVCIAQSTVVTYELDTGPPTSEIGQEHTVLLVIVEGELQLMLVEGCAHDPGGDTCTVTNGTATFRTAADPLTPVDITATWTPIPPGSIVTLSDVTFSVQTTTTPVRLLASGVAVDPGAGGACPCLKWPP
ncbi:MAG: hypothetical protein M3464_00755 [Chloroflexota bacterium]|nr:hypothetical protein [Chloroflexota bacterium]